MKLLTLIFVCLFCSSTYAIDWETYKNRLRQYTRELLGENTAAKVFGEQKKEPKYKVPTIPEIKENATSIDIYSSDYPIHSQGSSFENLPREQKRKYHLAFLEELFQVVRNTEAREEELSSFLNVLDQGGTREGVYRKIVLDEVYASLENFQENPNEKLIEFATSYGEKFLNRSFSKESMKSFNLYSIKRILGEKTLEVLDALAPNAEDVYAWYAVFSTDVAKAYPGLWQNRARLNQDEDFQYNWAKSVPFQQIKSEVIIKLNIIMNYLQKS